MKLPPKPLIGQTNRPAAPRQTDALDRLAATGMVDLHADTALHDLPLAGDGHPGAPMRVFMHVVDAFSHLLPRLTHFTRQVTRDSLDHEGKGVQVFSAVTRGLPPVYEGSAKLYEDAIVGAPRHASQTALNSWVNQAGWVYREVEANADRLQLAPDTASTIEAMREGKIAAQLGIEGAFPFENSQLDIGALRAFLAQPDNGLPASMPRPTEAELQSRGGLLKYARRLGVQYLGLNHLASSQFSGSDLWPNQDRGGGITADGHALVKQMSDAGVMLDLAHASHTAQHDAAGMVARGEYRLPLLVSHAVFALPGQAESSRTTDPVVLDAVRSSGGIVGIMAARAYLPHGASHDPQLIIGDIADQVDLLRSRIGVDSIGLGLDADGFVGLPYQTSAEVGAAIRSELQRRGYSDDELAKVFGGNYLHVLERRDQVMAG